MARGRRSALLLAALAAGWPGPGVAEDGPDLSVEEFEPVAITFGHFYEGSFGSPFGVTCDARSGEMYVADSGRGLIGIYDARAAPLFSFGDPEHLAQPVKAIPDAAGRILVLDSNDRRRIRRYSYRGDFLSFVDLEGMAAQPDLSITAMALEPDGTLLVGDSGNGEVLVFDAHGRLKFRFGNKGQGRGEFGSIMGIATTPEAIVVSDALGVGVQVFDRRGRFLRGWGRHEAGRDNVSLPMGITVDGQGRVALIDSLRQEIKVWDLKGNLIGLYGGAGRLPGEVLYPTDASFDGQGRLCVADRGNKRVQILRPRLPKPKAGKPQ